MENINVNLTCEISKEKLIFVLSQIDPGELADFLQELDHAVSEWGFK